MLYYNPVSGLFISPGGFAALYGVTPTASSLASFGFFPYQDPLEGVNASPFFTSNGFATQETNQLANYAPTADLINLLNSIIANPAVPVGQVSFFATGAVPAGYLVCDGSVYNLSDYVALGTLLGNFYGGNGTTTFAVPDLRGQFLRGFDDGAGVDPGRVFGSTQDDAFEAHTHIIPDSGGAAGAKTVAGTVSKVENYTTGGDTSSTGGTETRPKNVALLPCIFSGVYTTPNPIIYGTISTSRTGNDFNDSYYITFYSNTFINDDTELFIPGTSTVIPYILPTQFNAFSEAFNTGDYLVQIREASTGVVLADFICPEAPAVPVSF